MSKTVLNTLRQPAPNITLHVTDNNGRSPMKI